LDELNKISGLAPASKWIPESDVYRLIVRSTLPAAEKFQEWLFEEVLPQIRKTGAYNIHGASGFPPAPLGPPEPAPVATPQQIFEAHQKNLDEIRDHYQRIHELKKAMQEAQQRIFLMEEECQQLEISLRGPLSQMERSYRIMDVLMDQVRKEMPGLLKLLPKEIGERHPIPPAMPSQSKALL
jgi:prophage antirepressor-like protein